MAVTRPAQTSSRTGSAVGELPYVPMAHPGTPRRWDRSSILVALSTWVRETGHQPRRQDWSGQRAGGTSAGQRKWMREHPRWPSSSCVAGHFGTWGRALEAAGLRARCRSFEDPVAERIRTAGRMAADGVSIRAIAQQLGVSVSTVYNYLRAGTCPQCGGPVASPRATRCLDCTAREPTVECAHTRETVREAIRAWSEECGRPPRYREWTPSRTNPGKWESESPRWPSAAVVCDLYREHPDPWNAALADAGAGACFRRWSDEAIRAALAAFWTRTGRRPARADLDTPEWGGPTARTLRRRFGDLERAWEALGPVPGAGRPTSEGERWLLESSAGSSC